MRSAPPTRAGRSARSATGALFSFQTLKPLNCYGGGMALVHDAALAARCAGLPTRCRGRARSASAIDCCGTLQRIFIRPWVFSISLFPSLWVSSLIDANPDVFLWEKIRSLDPLPDRLPRALSERAGGHRPRSVERLDGWTAQVQANAAYMNRALGEIPGLRVPLRPARPDARLLPVLRLRPGRSAPRRSRRALCPEGDRHRDAARRRAARDGVVPRRDGGSRRRAPGDPGDSVPDLRRPDQEAP